MIPYYPEVQVISTPTNVRLNTVLRKEYEGTWYIWKILKSWDIMYEFDIVDLINDFHKEVYKCLILGRYSPGLFPDGTPFFPKSETQQSEEERLSDQIALKK
jgi:hypothetical protein